jgi:hypothetical protein
VTPPPAAGVPVMMGRVQLALARAARRGEGATPLHFISPDGEDSDLSYLRRSATISLDVQSGSARPYLGPLVLAAKRRLRRAMRWYMAPIAEQQSRFNHAALDLLEKLRTENEQLRARLEQLVDDAGGPGPG